MSESPDSRQRRGADEIVDLRDGYRIEVESTIMPVGEYAARFYRRRYTPGGRTTWRQVGPLVLAATPEKAARDLMDAMNTGQFPGVEVRG